MELHVVVEIAWELVDAFVELLTHGDREELLFQGSVEAFTEAVGFRRAEFGAAVLDLIDGQIEFEEVVQLAATVFAAIVGEQVLDGDRVFLVNGSTRSCRISTAVMGALDRYSLANAWEQWASMTVWA